MWQSHPSKRPLDVEQALCPISSWHHSFFYNHRQWEERTVLVVRLAWLAVGTSAVVLVSEAWRGIRLWASCSSA